MRPSGIWWGGVVWKRSGLRSSDWGCVSMRLNGMVWDRYIKGPLCEYQEPEFT